MRVFRAVELHFRLATPQGSSIETSERRWVFEIPAARDHREAWHELLHRIFYDQNVEGRRAEPGDWNWLAMDRFEVSPIDLTAATEWSGARDPASIAAHVPWHAAMTATSPACWWVDDEGRYDGMEAEDFSELIGLRRFAAGELDEAGLVRFLDTLYPGFGARVFAERATRLANIACVRTRGFRKAPGEPPIASGPPRAAHVSPPSAGAPRAPAPASPPSAGADAPAPVADALEEPVDDAPGGASWRLHPFTILGVILAVIVGFLLLGHHRERREHEAVDEAIAALEAAWGALEADARPRMAKLIEILGSAGSPAEGGCAGLSGALTVIHRPLLDKLAAGGSRPWGGPYWLSSAAWNYLARERSPERTVESHRRRDEVVRAAITGPCVAVLETEHVHGARLVGERRFDGGEVVGNLRVVCVDDPRVACEAPIASTSAAIETLKQREGRFRDGEEAAALQAAGREAYWEAIEGALADRGGSFRVERAER